MPSTNYLNLAVRKFVCHSISLTAPASLSVALYTTLPDADNVGGVEPSGGNYARVNYSCGNIYWTADPEDNNTFVNTNSITFPTPSAAWGTVLGFGLFDDSDNLLFFNSLTAALQVFESSPAPEFAPGAIRITT